MVTNPDRETDALTTVEQTARDWLLALSSGEASETDMAQFAAWRDADPRHRAAFEDIRRLWRDLEPLKDVFSVAPVASIGRPPAGGGVGLGRNGPARRQARSRRFALALSLVASLALVVGATAGGFGIGGEKAADYRTVAGEQRSVTLPDGSTVHLNTDTAVAVTLQDARRTVSLLRGEALFDVAPDRARPFTVEAPGGSATATGTAFSVRRTGDSVIVTVTEGSVRVAAPADAKDRGGAAVRPTGTASLKPGDQVSFRTDMPLDPVRSIDISTATAWRRGLIAVDAQPLSRAVAEIARYRSGAILLLAEDAGREPVTARIPLDAIDGGLRAIAAANGLSVTSITDGLLIIH